VHLVDRHDRLVDRRRYRCAVIIIVEQAHEHANAIAGDSTATAPSRGALARDLMCALRGAGSPTPAGRGAPRSIGSPAAFTTAGVDGACGRPARRLRAR
jgi:hypothetical protein